MNISFDWFMIALIPPVLMAYAQHGLRTALVVLAGYILINRCVENLVKPVRMGDSLKVLGSMRWGQKIIP